MVDTAGKNICPNIDVTEFRRHGGTTAMAKEKKERIVARAPATVRKTIQMAAHLQGAALNQFLIRSAYKEARQILDEEIRIQLTSAQAEQVFSLIENPPKSNTRLLRAAWRLKARVRVHA